MPDPVSNWEVFKWAWENRREIRKLLSGVHDWFRGKGRKDKRGILVIGPGGSGKTTLALILSGEFDWLTSSPWKYAESRKLERYILKDDPHAEVVVPPGQKHRREVYWADLHAEVAAGKYRGVILLTAYGYHTLGALQDSKSHPRTAKTKRLSLQTYLEEQRQEELRVLRQLAPYVLVCPRRVWFVTLVAKQDLWWDNRSDVERHYTSGEFGDELQKIATAMTTRMFRHEIAYASLVISNFATGMRERLQDNLAGYDQQMQVESIRRLLETIADLKVWELEP